MYLVLINGIAIKHTSLFVCARARVSSCVSFTFVSRVPKLNTFLSDSSTSSLFSILHTGPLTRAKVLCVSSPLAVLQAYSNCL